MIKNRLFHPLLWLCIIFIVALFWGDKIDFKSYFKKHLPQPKHQFKQSESKDEYIIYSKFMLAIIENDHIAIKKYGGQMNDPGPMAIVIRELVINMNFDTAVAKAKKYQQSQLAKRVLGLNAFKLKQYESAIKYLKNDNERISKIAIILSKNQLGQQFTIPKELKALESELNNKNPQKLIASIMSHSQNEFLLKMAFFIDGGNINVITDIASTLLQNKQYAVLADFVKNIPDTDRGKILLINIIDRIPKEQSVENKKILDLFKPEDKFYYFAKATYELKQRQYKQALDSIEKVREFDDYYLFNFIYGIILEKNKLHIEAIEKLKIADQQSNSEPTIANYLAYSMIEQNLDLEDNLDKLLIAYKKMPEDYIADSVGWAYYKLGNYEISLIYMNIAINGMPADGVVNDHLGDVYFKLGRTREAITQWNRAIELDADNPYIDVEKIKQKIKKHSLKTNE